jgi:hypothetical protein
MSRRLEGGVSYFRYSLTSLDEENGSISEYVSVKCHYPTQLL